MKPILFNTEMVRAILNGEKTVTRRLVKPAHLKVLESPYHIEHPEVQEKALIEKLCQPPYQPGDILYVRETWNYGYFESSDREGDVSQWFEELSHKGKKQDSYLYALAGYIYRADFDEGEEVNYGIEHDDGTIRMDWRPSIHMPKEAARIFLKVTDVRVERLHEIKNHECVAEGAVKRPDYTKRHDLVLHNRYRQVFAELWDSTIKPSDIDRYGWEANPWVWVISFERCEKPKEANNG